jgi:hypothetical protein
VSSRLSLIFEFPHLGEGYVAASLNVTVTVGAIDYPIGPIVLAMDTRSPAPPDVAVGDLAFITSIGYDSVKNVDRYSARGFSSTGLIGLPQGSEWNVHGTFSGVADPGAAILIADPLFIGDGESLPEPAPLWLLLGGMSGLALLLRVQPVRRKR